MKPPGKRRWLRRVLLALPVIVVALAAWAYFAFAWIFFVKPGDGGPHLALPIVTVAGSTNSEAGFADGQGPAARLAKPIRLAAHPQGGLVFADINNHAVRRLRTDGSVVTLAGSPDRKGHQDGPAAQAKFSSPHGVAVRADGVIAVAEAGNNDVRLLTPVPNGKADEYVASTFAGVPGKSGMLDGPCQSARFRAPHAVAWGPRGELYIADIGNARIRVVEGDVCRTLAGGDRTGQDDGNLTTGTLKYPMDLVLDAQGALWIADAGTLTIRKWTDKEGLTTPFPGLRLAMPHGIAIGPDGAVIVAELNGQRILAFDPATRQVKTLCGTTEKGNGERQLRRPAAVLVQQRTVWIADLGNHRLARIELP